MSKKTEEERVGFENIADVVGSSVAALYVSQKRQKELAKELEARLHNRRLMGHPIVRGKSAPRGRRV